MNPVQAPLNPGYRIVQATPAFDLEKIALVVNTAYLTAHPYLKANAERTSASDLEQVLKDPEKRLFVCLSPAGEICGTAQLRTPRQSPGIRVLINTIPPLKEILGGEGEVSMVTMHPKFQGLKLGSYLMNFVERKAFFEHKVQSIKVETTLRSLVDFYERRGYQFNGEMRPFEPTELLRPGYEDKLFFSILKKQAPIQCKL